MNAYREIRHVLVIAIILLLGVYSTIFLFQKMTRENLFKISRPAQMWALKTLPRKNKKVVAIGDSRVYRGLDTAIIESQTGLESINLGFSGGGLSRPLFELANGFLVSYGKRIVIIGLTANSLTEEATLNKHLKELIEKPYLDRLSTAYLEPLLVLTSPKILKLPAGTNYLENYRPYGFVASDYRVRNTNEALNSYRERLKKNKISNEAIVGLNEQIRKWKVEGVTVYFYIPPVGKEMKVLEEELTGFYSSGIADQLTKNGAEEINVGEFETYDGSHLTADSAKSLSEIIAGKIKSNLLTN